MKNPFPSSSLAEDLQDLQQLLKQNSEGQTSLSLKKGKTTQENDTFFLLDSSLKFLDKWQVQIPNLILLDDHEVIIGLTTVKNLELGLAERVNTLGIPKILGEFIEFGEGNIFIEQQGVKFEMPYDLVVGADGSHSAVRECLGIVTKNYGEAIGSIIYLPYPKGENLEYILPFQSGPLFLNKIIVSIGTIIATQGKELSKEIFISEVLTQGWTEEALAMSNNEGRCIDNIEILLQQSVTFSNSKKSVIILGDAAASASFLQGKGANSALEGAITAGRFFATEMTDEDYSNFDNEMQRITDRLIKDSNYLFDISTPEMQ